MTEGPPARWKSSGISTPSKKVSVWDGLAPRTMSCPRPKGARATPGKFWMTRMGSPKVPGSFCTSLRSTVRRTTSFLSFVPRTTVWKPTTRGSMKKRTSFVSPGSRCSRVVNSSYSELVARKEHSPEYTGSSKRPSSSEKASSSS